MNIYLQPLAMGIHAANYAENLYETHSKREFGERMRIRIPEECL